MQNMSHYCTNSTHLLTNKLPLIIMYIILVIKEKIVVTFSAYTDIGPLESAVKSA